VLNRGGLEFGAGRIDCERCETRAMWVPGRFL